jgi:hypothetical protein
MTDDLKLHKDYFESLPLPRGWCFVPSWWWCFFKSYPFLMISWLMIWNFIRIILKAYPSLVADVLYPHDDDFLNLIPSSWLMGWKFEVYPFLFIEITPSSWLLHFSHMQMFLSVSLLHGCWFVPSWWWWWLLGLKCGSETKTLFVPRCVCKSRPI